MPFLRCKIIKNLPDGGVLCPLCSSFVEPASFDFHCARLSTNGIEPKWTVQPDGSALHESFHVLATNQRYVLTKFLPVEFNQATSVAGLLCLHGVEN